MSRTLVMDETLRVMLWAGLRGATAMQWRSADGTLRTLAHDNAAEIGALLRETNARSFYDPDVETWEEMGLDPVYHHASPRYTEWSTIELLRTVDYFEYQVDEAPWSVEVYNFCDGLREHLFPQLPGIDGIEVIGPDSLPWYLGSQYASRLLAADVDAVPVEHVRVVVDALLRLTARQRIVWPQAAYPLGKIPRTNQLTAENASEVGKMLWEWCGARDETYEHGDPIFREWSATELVSAARTLESVGSRRPGWDDSEAHLFVRAATGIFHRRIPSPRLWGIYDKTLPVALR